MPDLLSSSLKRWAPGFAQHQGHTKRPESPNRNQQTHYTEGLRAISNDRGDPPHVGMQPVEVNLRQEITWHGLLNFRTLFGGADHNHRARNVPAFHSLLESFFW